MSEHFRLPLQVDFCIDIRRGDRNMAEPGADGVDIDGEWKAQAYDIA